MDVRISAYWLAPLAAMLTAWAVTRIALAYARRQSLIDEPGERTAHVLPTPRGGGVGLVAAFLAATVWLYLQGVLHSPAALAMLVGGSAVAMVGAVDDHRHVPAGVRMSVHGIAALIVVWLLGAPLLFPGFEALPGGRWMSAVIALLTLVWLTNLHNFMDGLDGLLAVQVVCVALAGVVFMAIVGQFHAGLWFAALAASALGFLVWNWPPARIFSGDVGSGFAGFAIGVLAYHTIDLELLTPWPWLIVCGLFVVDTTLTVVSRARGGERVTLAHNQHAFQRVARYLNSHRRVSLAFLGINLVWLVPWAICAVLWPGFGLLAWLVAWTPLIIGHRWIARNLP